VLYQVSNNGFWYNLGYIIGLIIIGAGSGASRRGSKTKEKAKSKKETTGERESIEDTNATSD
jgi:hypothetical protein